MRLVLAQREVSFSEVVQALTEFEVKQKRAEPDAQLVRSILDDLVKEGFFKQVSFDENLVTRRDKHLKLLLRATSNAGNRVRFLWRDLLEFLRDR